MKCMIPVRQLQDLASAGSYDASHLLCVDLRDGLADAAGVQSAAAWLKHCPVPVVGLGNPAVELMDSFDLVLGSEDELHQVADKVQQNPTAASVLVQVTRVTPLLPVTEALRVESLAYATLQAGKEHAEWLAGNAFAGKPSKAIDDPVRLIREDDTLQIVLTNRENSNALSVSMRDALSEAFQLVAADDSIRQVTVSGEGRCFSAGGDLTEFGSCRDPAEAHRIRQLSMPAQFLAPHADRYTFRLHGACIGAGIELPAFAAKIMASSDACFRLPEVGMGLIPGAGGCVSLPRRIGRQRTNYLAIMGDNLSAETALQWGLVDEIR